MFPSLPLHSLSLFGPEPGSKIPWMARPISCYNRGPFWCGDFRAWRRTLGIFCGWEVELLHGCLIHLQTDVQCVVWIIPWRFTYKSHMHTRSLMFFWYRSFRFVLEEPRDLHHFPDAWLHRISRFAEEFPSHNLEGMQKAQVWLQPTFFRFVDRFNTGESYIL